MSLLIDPRLLCPPGYPGAPLSAAPEFWNQVISWASDARAKLGPESYKLVCEWYAEHGYPDQNLELDVPTLRHEYQAALSRILSRVHLATNPVESKCFNPSYTGTELEEISIQMDVSCTADLAIAGIATAPDHWNSTDATEIEVEPPPPASLHLCSTPGAELPSEECERIHKFYKDKRLHIVGGREERRIIDSLVTTLGLKAADITWHPCEKAKPPRNLDNRWRYLEPGRDITVCITGRAGHATSEKAKAAAERAGVTYLFVEYPSGLEAELVRLVRVL
ncbi:hypothetical protein GCM10007979_36660 [Nocardioides albus]|nr:hypothetical protein GCM10007979_36660 [Nocardioides albus]